MTARHPSPVAPPAPRLSQHLARILSYPLRGAALAALAGFTLASLLGYVPILGGLFNLIILLGVYKFAFEILRASADGREDAPEIVSSVDNGTIWRFVALQLLFVLLPVLAGWLGGPPASISVVLIVALLQPGAIMSLAIDGDLGRALHPGTTLALIGRIGADYFAVSVLLFGIHALTSFAVDGLEPHLPPVIGPLGLTLFVFWGVFVAFHLMGWLVHRYHAELGYEPAAQRDRRAAPADRDRDLLHAAEHLLHAQGAAAAIARLGDEVRDRVVGSAVHDRYRRLLLGAGERAAADAHARVWLNLLMLDGEERRALGLLREALDANPDFVPLQPEHAHRLLQRAAGAGQAQLQLDLLQSLLRHAPRDEEAPRRALQAAQLLSLRFDRGDEARAVLQQALPACRDAATLTELQAALARTGAA